MADPAEQHDDELDPEAEAAAEEAAFAEGFDDPESADEELSEADARADEAFANLDTNEEEGESEPEPEPEATAEQPETAGEADQTEPEPEPPEESDPVQRRVRNLEGKFGEVNATLQRMNQQLADMASNATSQVRQEGGDAPTARQVEAATVSSEKMDALMAEFPEWGEAMQEQSALNRQQILKELSPETIEQRVREQLGQEFQNQLQEGVRMARMAARIDAVHENWEQDVNSPDYEAWITKQSADVQALGESQNPKDAIALLDKFYGEAQSQESGEATPSSDPRRRLERSVPPTKNRGSSDRNRVPTEEEDFEDGFKNG